MLSGAADTGSALQPLLPQPLSHLLSLSSSSSSPAPCCKKRNLTLNAVLSGFIEFANLHNAEEKCF